MFSSAFKSFSSNIISNYEVSKQPTATAGAWTIFDAKKKSTGVQASVFVFERKLLEVQSNGFDRRTSATSLRKVQEEVVERLKKEASSLARLRHPSVLQLVEPVEDTRSGGLMFATELVLASLSGALAQKDRNERVSSGRRDNRDYGISPASRTSQDIELDELEVQKGLLQVSKGLEFLHDSAKLVHGNLNPDAIFINAKSDWKISGLSFAGPSDGAEGHQTIPQISLSEVLYLDSRIPPTVQLNLDYTSPDFVLDTNVNFSADIFSLGLVLLACYRTPHTSPIEANGNQSTYKKIFNNASTAPGPRNNYLCDTKLPNELEQVLPRLLARRPAQRMNAAEFQQSGYFDNILVNTMRFLDGLPAKTPAEKSQFMKGLQRVMPQFPVSVLGKKILSALLDELKDKDLLGLILENIFLILQKIPTRQEALSDKVLPKLRDIFLAKSKSEERDTGKEAGLNVFMANIRLVTENTTAKQFKDDALPIIYTAMESSTHSIVDTALSTLATVLPVLDFSTVKHDLFPAISNVFTKTSSLGIKVRGLEALGVLCGATSEDSSSNRADDLSGVIAPEKSTNKTITSSLDKFTMQEKVVPLLKGIKTKEPIVMMAALRVFQQIGKAGDIDFLAVEVMPILWAFALGPLLDLTQFKAYMDTIRSLSGRIEREQIRKLQELSSSTSSSTMATRSEPTRAASAGKQHQLNGLNGAGGVEDDFAKLVLSNRGSSTGPSNSSSSKDPFAGAMSEGQKLTPNPPSFSWSSTTGPSVPASTTRPSMGMSMSMAAPLQPVSRSITPDVQGAGSGMSSMFPALQPTSASSASAWATPAQSQPLQPQPQLQTQRMQASNYNYTSSTSSNTTSNINPWTQPSPATSTSTSTSAFNNPAPGFAPMLAPPPKSPPASSPLQQPNYTSLSHTLTPNQNQNIGVGMGMNVLQPQTRGQTQPQRPQPQKSGLDKYESLL